MTKKPHLGLFYHYYQLLSKPSGGVYATPQPDQGGEEQRQGSGEANSCNLKVVERKYAGLGRAGGKYFYAGKVVRGVLGGLSKADRHPGYDPAFASGLAI